MILYIILTNLSDLPWSFPNIWMFHWGHRVKATDCNKPWPSRKQISNGSFPNRRLAQRPNLWGRFVPFVQKSPSQNFQNGGVYIIYIYIDHIYIYHIYIGRAMLQLIKKLMDAGSNSKGNQGNLTPRCRAERSGRWSIGRKAYCWLDRMWLASSGSLPWIWVNGHWRPRVWWHHHITNRFNWWW